MTGNSYALCIHTGEYRGSLERHKLYRTKPANPRNPPGLLNVYDESGEDYLYPADWFLPIDLPEEVAAAFEEEQAAEDARWSNYRDEEIWAQLADLEDAAEFLYQQIEELYLTPAQREEEHVPPRLPWQRTPEMQEDSVTALLARIRQAQTQLDLVCERARTLPVTPILTPRNLSAG